MIGEDGVQDKDLIDGWFGSLVSDSCKGRHGEETEVDLPEKSLRNHHESEAGVGNEASSPAIVGSVHSGSDLIKVIRESHSPLPVVVLEDMVAVIELSWVSLGLLWFETGGSSNVGSEIKVVAVNRSRWLESLIVISGVSCLSS